MEIEDPAGANVATVAKAMITALRERFTVNLASGEQLRAHGDIVDHEFAIENDGKKIAEISKEMVPGPRHLRRRGRARRERRADPGDRGLHRPDDHPLTSGPVAELLGAQSAGPAATSVNSRRCFSRSSRVANIRL